MITDVFSAGFDSLPGYRDAGFPDPTEYGYQTVRARGLDPVALASLDVLLSDVAYETALETANETPATKEPDLYSAPVLTTLSERIVRVLPAVGQDNLDRLATDWHDTTPELSDRDPAALRSWLERVRDLCRATVPQGNVLFVWNCL
ncbi:hypothetical protein D5S17_03810 [Pseudonocardiaceae bacterium YIM PH 21723]|nr:hypothetical protein D5S17_03810 [Pseudonocardiaceae bacterium YIM PH 21723]